LAASSRFNSNDIWTFLLALRSRQKSRRNCLDNFAIDNRQAQPVATKAMSEKRPQAGFSS
jgi:hypothetical protein